MPLQAGRDVPEISRFYGIVVRMYYDDHPPPHFHAQYGRHEVTIHLSTLAVKDGWLPKRVLTLLMHWAALHGDELMENWTLARLGQAVEAD